MRRGRGLVAAALLAPAIVLGACAGPPPAAVPGEVVAADAALCEAVDATRFVLRLKEIDEDGSGRGGAACAVSIAEGLVLTAAHCVPGGLLAGEVAQAEMHIGDRVRDVRLVAAGAAPTSAEEAERARLAPEEDWALLRVHEPGDWAPVVRWGEPVEGEAAYVVGFPVHYLPEGWAEGIAWSREAGGGWRAPTPVVLEGRIERAGDGWFRVRGGGGLGARVRGASGGGVFVRRGGEIVLVGIANKSRLRGSFFSAAAVPAEARDAMMPGKSRPDSPSTLRTRVRR